MPAIIMIIMIIVIIFCTSKLKKKMPPDGQNGEYYLQTYNRVFTFASKL